MRAEALGRAPTNDFSLTERKLVDGTASCLINKMPYLDFSAVLPGGWPIASTRPPALSTRETNCHILMWLRSRT